MSQLNDSSLDTFPDPVSSSSTVSKHKKTKKKHENHSETDEHEHVNSSGEQVIQMKPDSDEWRSIKEMDFLFAAQLIRDARDLRNLTFKKTEVHLKSYQMFLESKYSWILYATFLVNLFLPIIEEPAVFKAPFWLAGCIEIVCLVIYLLRWIHLRSFQTGETFNKDKKNYVLLFTIILILIDVIVYFVTKSLNAQFVHRFTRPLRILVYINFNEGKELRRAFRNVRKTLPDIFNVFALFLISLLIFSFVAWRLFKDQTYQGRLIVYSNNQSYFQDYEDSLWDLYISVTTANFPDIMMPAYDVNGAYAIFFIVFMLINLYLFINIILATIYTNYKKHLKEEVKMTIKLKRDKMKDAFDLVKIKLNDLINRPESLNQSLNLDEDLNHEFKQTELLSSDNEHVITNKVFLKLIKLVDPTKQDNHFKILFQLLDFDENKLLTFKEFVYLADLLNFRISEIKDRLTLLEKYIPKVYNHQFSNFLKRLVRHKIFQIFFDFLIFLNILLIIIKDTTGTEWIFLSMFIVEILLKVYVYGIKEFFSSFWNIFDTFVIFGGLIAGIIDEVNGASELFEVVLILRSMRLLKFVASIKRFRVIITTIAIIIPSLITYAMLLLSVYYIFSMIGMEIFGKAIQSQNYDYSMPQTYNCLNQNLRDTDFVRMKYCKNNFSSFPNSFVLLFELMVVNQWHSKLTFFLKNMVHSTLSTLFVFFFSQNPIISRGFEDAFQSKWTRLYFFSFHIICVIVLLNIFTAFVIEAFLLEYENDDEKSLDSKLEKRIIQLELNFDQSEDKKSLPNPLEKKFILIRAIESLKGIFKNDEENSNSNGGRINDKNKGIKFHINSKEPKAVEILLQRMFQNEFDISSDDLIVQEKS